MTTKKIARKASPGGARSAPVKRVPKKALPRADYRTLAKTQKLVQQQAKEIAQLRAQLATANRSLAAAQKRQTIAQAAKQLRQVQKETNRYQRNFKANVKAFGKLLDAFRVKGKTVKPSTKAAATKAQKVVQKITPVVKRVPKKQPAAKAKGKKQVRLSKKGAAKAPPKKGTKKVPKKQAQKKAPVKTGKKAPVKRAPKKAAKKAPAKPALPAHVVARASEYKKPHPVPKHIVLAAREGIDYDYPLAPSEQTSVMVRDRVSDLHLYNTLEEAIDAADTYADNAQAEIVTISFKPKSTSVESQMRGIKAQERRKAHAEWKVKEQARKKELVTERRARKAAEKRVKQLEKEMGFKREEKGK